MKVIVTGADGQLGLEVVKLLQMNHETYGLNRIQLDVTDKLQCEGVINSIKPDVIIHCAAFTAVDLAENEQEIAFLVNAHGTQNVALAAEQVGAKLCYISTDYVFDGLSKLPYLENDVTNPKTVYGKSKEMGEMFTRKCSSKHFIVRTSWVYGQHGNNFVKTMLKLSKTQNQLKVVADQIGSPTYTKDLAQFISDLIVTDKYGTYHATNSGSCSWFEFAKAIFEECQIEVEVNSCTTDEFPRPAQRPPYSVLDHAAIHVNGFQDLRDWREGLRDFLGQYCV
jgi:dTDP-4-dehydrorhamnose reductase